MIEKGGKHTIKTVFSLLTLSQLGLIVVPTTKKNVELEDRPALNRTVI